MGRVDQDLLARKILGLAASDPGGALAWLDGGATDGWFCLEPDVGIEADDLGVLAAVETLWRAQPDRVWVGQLDYELGSRPVLGTGRGPGPRPSLRLRRYSAAISLTTQQKFHGDTHACARLRARLDAATALQAADWPLARLTAHLPAATYRARVVQAQAFIAAGETYQVNLSQAFAAEWLPGWQSRPLSVRAANVYAMLRAASPAGMGALLAGDDGPGPARWVVSNSPETLLEVVPGAGHGGGDLVRSWPIKGTRARSADPTVDAAAAAELLASAKDLAEHVMIVDLVRNDLGRLAVAGTVVAPRRPTLVSLPTVHHLVSEVCATLRPGWHLGELLAAMFPAGSITGAPKRRTMQIIDTLEQRRRGLYCGGILVLSPHGLRCSIPIRTGELDAAGLHLQSGGGIVSDSDPEAELQETWAKTRAFDRPA